MDQNGWDWARLTRDKMEMLKDAERTLGADVLLAYRSLPAEGDTTGEIREQSPIRVADLDESQVECLQGLEEKLQAVVVAYEMESTVG